MAQGTLETILVILSFLLNALVFLVGMNGLRDAINGLRVDIKILIDRGDRSND